MKNIIFIFTCWLFIGSVSAQNSWLGSGSGVMNIDLCGTVQTFSGRMVPGFTMDFSGTAGKRIYVGISLSSLQIKTSNAFNYPIQSPVISIGKYGFMAQFAFLQLNKFRINFHIVNGLLLTRLGDNDDKVWVRRGRYTYHEPKTYATDKYFFIMPGTEISARLLRSGNFSLWLDQQVRYTINTGSGKFTSASEFRGFQYLFGIQISLSE